MAHLAETLRVVATMLQPCLTHAPKKIIEQLGLDEESGLSWEKIQFGNFPEGITVVKKKENQFSHV